MNIQEANGQGMRLNSKATGRREKERSPRTGLRWRSHQETAAGEKGWWGRVCPGQLHFLRWLETQLRQVIFLSR